MREQLKDLLPPDEVDDAVPEYPTQNDVDHVEEWSGGEDDDDEPTISVDLRLDELTVDQWVEVYWKGEDRWFIGQITDICQQDNTFEVYYEIDSECLWHKFEDYPVRLSV